MTKFNLPHRANVGEIIRVRGYESTLFLVLELLEEVSHDKNGSEPQVTYTCRNVDNPKEVKIIFDQDVVSIVTTADKTEGYLAMRQAQPKPLAKKDTDNKGSEVGKIQIDIEALMRMYQEALNQREEGKKKTDNNAPRSPWAKEREEKRKAYEYIDFLLERYADLVSMQQVMPHDKEIQSEIDLVKAEFMEKSGAKIVQDGKYS